MRQNQSMLIYTRRIHRIGNVTYLTDRVKSMVDWTVLQQHQLSEFTSMERII